MVRYLTIPRQSLEIVAALQEKEKALYLDVVCQFSQQLENGEVPSFAETDSRILNIVLKETAAEVSDGYKNYTQKINARKKNHQKEQIEQIEQKEQIEERSIGDLSAIHQRSIGDQPIRFTEADYQILIRDGFSRQEIDGEISQIDWAGVKNPIRYLQSVLKNKKRKTVTAQEYNQRDYPDGYERPDDVFARLSADLGGMPHG